MIAAHVLSLHQSVLGWLIYHCCVGQNLAYPGSSCAVICAASTFANGTALALNVLWLVRGISTQGCPT
jgi:hypothetical protein